MPKRPAGPQQIPTALRDAVDRTMRATAGSAERSRERTQGAIDDLVGLVRGAEAQVSRGRRAVGDVIDDRRPATHEDVAELKAELRAIGRRLDAIEERLPVKRASAKRAPAKRAPSKRAPARHAAAKRAPAKRSGS